ncbi:MAG: hypothetical protein AB1813_25295 [Verrucomicrobiota bacterium]
MIGLSGNCISAASGGGKGGGGYPKDPPISSQFWLDDLHTAASGIPSALANRVVADGNTYTSDPTLPATTVEPSYQDTLENVSVQVMGEQNINIHLAYQYKKPAVRHFLWSAGFPEDLPAHWAPAPTGVNTTADRPDYTDATIPITMFQIYGLNHDDTPPGIIRYVNARLVVRDHAGETWTVYFGSRPNSAGFKYAPGGSCMAVQRLPNTPAGNARWRFWTEGQTIVTPEGLAENVHLGYLYKFDGKPVSEFFAALVDLPMSGTIESRNPESEPAADGYLIPEDPIECP